MPKPRFHIANAYEPNENENNILCSCFLALFFFISHCQFKLEDVRWARPVNTHFPCYTLNKNGNIKIDNKIDYSSFIFIVGEK